MWDGLNKDGEEGEHRKNVFEHFAVVEWVVSEWDSTGHEKSSNVQICSNLDSSALSVGICNEASGIPDP